MGLHVTISVVAYITVIIFVAKRLTSWERMILNVPTTCGLIFIATMWPTGFYRLDMGGFDSTVVHMRIVSLFLLIIFYGKAMWLAARRDIMFKPPYRGHWPMALFDPIKVTLVTVQGTKQSRMRLWISDTIQDPDIDDIWFLIWVTSSNKAANINGIRTRLKIQNIFLTKDLKRFYSIAIIRVGPSKNIFTALMSRPMPRFSIPPMDDIRKVISDGEFSQLC